MMNIEMNPIPSLISVLAFAIIGAGTAFSMEMSDASAYVKDRSVPAFLLVGPIVEGDAEKLSGLLAPTNGAETVLFVSSDGGSVDAAFELGEVIAEHGNVRLNVVDKCVSACATIIFPSSQTAELLPGAHLAFHSCYDGQSLAALPECDTKIAEYAANRGFPYGAVDMWTRDVPASEVHWVGYTFASCFGYYRREGDPVGVEQEQPCVRGMLRAAATEWGRNYYEAELIADCGRQEGVREFALCSQRELTQVRGLLDHLYELLLSHTPDAEQAAVEAAHRDWLADFMQACPTPKTVEELADVKIASEVERCFADQLYARLVVVEKQLANATAP